MDAVIFARWSHRRPPSARRGIETLAIAGRTQRQTLTERERERQTDRQEGYSRDGDEETGPHAAQTGRNSFDGRNDAEMTTVTTPNEGSCDKRHHAPYRRAFCAVTASIQFF